MKGLNKKEKKVLRRIIVSAALLLIVDVYKRQPHDHPPGRQVHGRP